MQSGSFRRSSDALEAIWSSLMPKSCSIENFNEDEEIVKLSLLLKSTQLLLPDLKQKHSSAVREIKALKDELLSMTQQKEKYETDAKNLQKELGTLKFELHTSEAKAKKCQKEAESATLKCRKLQSNISSEVDNRLLTMFKVCLQQNKAADKAVTFQDMMTQLQTQPQFTEYFIDEQPGAKVQRVADLCGKEGSRPKTPLSRANLGDSSPEKSLILGTPPDVSKKNPDSRRDKSSKDQVVKPKPFATILNSVASSPDEIAPTPPPDNEKKDSKKRGKHRLLNGNIKAAETSLRKAIVFATDTQDVNELAPVEQRHALKENIIIPETLHQENCEEEVIHQPQPPSSKNKENGSGSSATGHHQKKSPIDPSTNVESPSTPQKVQRTRELSPIFRSGSKKKSGARPSNTSLCSSSKKPRMKTSSFQSANEADRSYRTTTSGRQKLSIQPKIEFSISKMNKSSKLSLKHSLRDNFSSSNPSKQEQINPAISNSYQGNHTHLSDDSDATLFLPVSPAVSSEKCVKENTKSAPNSSTSLKEGHNYFEPLFASTEKEVITPAKRQKTPICQEETLPSQFKPPFASSGKESDFIPLYASTEKDPMANSALDELVELLENDAMDANLPAEDSYDFVPRDNAIPDRPVRKKNERRNLPALECTQCGKFFAAAFGDDPNARKLIVNHCSRHRDRTGLGRPITPPGYWEVGWRSPEVAKEAQEV